MKRYLYLCTKVTFSIISFMVHISITNSIWFQRYFNFVRNYENMSKYCTEVKFSFHPSLVTSIPIGDQIILKIWLRSNDRRRIEVNGS